MSPCQTLCKTPNSYPGGSIVADKYQMYEAADVCKGKELTEGGDGGGRN